MERFVYVASCYNNEGFRLITTSDSATAEGAAAITSATPSVDVLVNNLGIYESKAFGDITDADWSHLFDVNVMSGVRLSRAYLPGMLERNWGRIIFISSESGLAIPQNMIHYATTKTAQLSVSRGLAQLTRGANVTVNAVLPGPTRSDGIEAFLRSQASDPSAPIKQIEASRDLGRLLTDFHAKGKITALVCHGPIALMSTLNEPTQFAAQLEAGEKPNPGAWIYEGYNFTVIGNQEEQQAKSLLQGGEMKFYPQTALEQADGRFSGNATPWTPHVVTDRDVITGENPASASQVGLEVLKRLK
ncbi:NAD(P)-dependent dehydrogenase (short-subunit alcohol dehydrogenase family) [Bosea sp. OAE752]